MARSMHEANWIKRACFVMMFTTPRRNLSCRVAFPEIRRVVAGTIRKSFAPLTVSKKKKRKQFDGGPISFVSLLFSFLVPVMAKLCFRF